MLNSCNYNISHLNNILFVLSTIIICSYIGLSVKYNVHVHMPFLINRHVIEVALE